jgi:hypothetical protein
MKIPERMSSVEWDSELELKGDTVNRLREILAILFPARTHLYEEIDYLRAQVAQKQRRIDELQDEIIELKRPEPKVVATQAPDGKVTIPAQPRGIEAFKANRRNNPPDEPEAVKGPFETSGEVYSQTMTKTIMEASKYGISR